MDDPGRRDELVGGWGGPLRRWRAMDTRDRVGTSLVTAVGVVAATVIYWLVALLLHDSTSWGTIVFWVVSMTLIYVYLPELVRLFHRWNE